MIGAVYVRIWLGLALLGGPPIHAADPGQRLKAEGALVAEVNAGGDVEVVSGQREERSMRAEYADQKQDETSQVATPASKLDSAQAAAALAVVGPHASVLTIHSKDGVPNLAPSKSDAVGPHEEHPIPPWAQILITSTLMLVIMSMWWTVRALQNSPVPRGAGSGQLAAVLQEALEKVQSLEEQLETRQEVDAMFVDSDDDAEVNGDPRAEAAIDAERRTREIQESAARMAEQSQRLNEGAVRAQEEFARGVDKAREVIQDCAEKETAGLFSNVKDAVNQNQATISKWEPPDWMTEEGHLQLPPLMQLISGAAASTQIRVIRFFNSGCISLGILMLILSVVTFIVDWERKCVDYSIWVWHIGLLSITTLDTLCRFLIVRNASSSLDFLKQSRQELDQEDTDNSSGGGIFEMFASFSRRSNKFFDASFKYYTLTDSWSYSFASLLSTVSLLWGAAGLYISIQHVVEDSLGCNARIALLYMHVYSFVYVMLLTWNILGVAIWILNFVSGSPIVRTPLVKFAKYCDDDVMRGMPIVLSLVQSFVLKDSSEVYSLKTRQVLKEIHEIEETKRKLCERLSVRKINRVRLQEMQQQVRSEDEFMNRCQQRVQTGLDELKPIVGLLAANVTTTEPAPDPTAAGSSGIPRRQAFVYFEDDTTVESF